jgi:DNA-binding LytR/AlgR family response regulator
LLKPVRPERLAQTIERVRAMAALKRRPTKVRAGEKVTQDDDRHWERIPIDEIAAVTGQGNYSHIHILDGGNLAVRRTMQEWNAQLAADGFVALTRSLLIHPAAISQLEIISRDETLVHLYGVPEPFRLGRAASLRARRCFRDRGRRPTGPGEPAGPGATDVTGP